MAACFRVGLHNKIVVVSTGSQIGVVEETKQRIPLVSCHLGNGPLHILDKENPARFRATLGHSLVGHIRAGRHVVLQPI